MSIYSQRWALLDKFISHFNWILVVISILLGVFVKIPLFREPLLTFFGTSEQGLFKVIFACLVISLSLIAINISRKSDLLAEKIDELNMDFEKNIFAVGTDGIYNRVNKEMRYRKILKKTNVVHIIGYTLFSVEPKLMTWKELGLLENIELNICHLDLSFIKECDNINSNWASKLESNLNQIQSFKVENKEVFKEKNVKINLYPYSNIPCIHGFKLDNGSMFISFSVWNDKNQIKSPNLSNFVRVDGADNSRQATELKYLFDNWLNKSMSY